MTDNAVLRLRQFRLDRATRPFWRAVAGWRVVRVACCRIKLPVRHHSSAAGRQPFLPDHVRRRAAQAQQHRPPDRRYPAGHPCVPLVAHRGRSRPAGGHQRSVAAALCGVPRFLRRRRTAGVQPAARRRQTAAVHYAGRHRAEARKMFRKSPYLNQFPVFSSTSTRHRTTSCAKPAAQSNTARRKWPPPCCNRRAICRPPTD